MESGAKSTPLRNEHHDDDEAIQLKKEQEAFISNLPKSSGWLGQELAFYKDFWYDSSFLHGYLAVERQIHQLVNHPIKALLVSYPKSGTTWLKALAFAITTRTQQVDSHPLMKFSPHDLVPFLEVYALTNMLNPISDAPILATHMPFSLLSETFKKSNFPIIYIYRNPKDLVVSYWHFANKLRSNDQLSQLNLEETVDLFCKGQSPCGPYWNHVSEYLDAARKQQMPAERRILILSYDGLKNDPISHIKKMAEFLGCPFSSEEVQQGHVAKIIELCDFKNMRNLEVNKSHKFMVDEKRNWSVENSSFFRKGEVGDYKNYLSDEMVAQLDAMLEEHKLKDIKLEEFE